jgi:toxin-antitoxin system PIN domain toxin
LTQAPVWLLDANLLIALTHSGHVHHPEAHAWFGARPKRRWATCTLTQLAFIRLTSNPRIAGKEISPAEAMHALADLVAQSTHEFWPDAVEPAQIQAMQSAALVGHRQVTDAYLLGLAAHRGNRLATLDRGLVSFALASDLAGHVELVTGPTLVQEAVKVSAKKRVNR